MLDLLPYETAIVVQVAFVHVGAFGGWCALAVIGWLMVRGGR